MPSVIKEETIFTSKIFFLVLLPLFLMPIFINIWASVNAEKFGMTAPEVIREFWLVALYFLVGGLAIIFTSRDKKNTKLIFAIRLATVMLAISMSYNQIAISRALAPVKMEFEKVAAGCVVKSGELKCGDALKQVLQKRDMALEKLNAVRVGEWRIIAVNAHNIITDRDSAYFYLPF